MVLGCDKSTILKVLKNLTLLDPRHPGGKGGWGSFPSGVESKLIKKQFPLRARGLESSGPEGGESDIAAFCGISNEGGWLRQASWRSDLLEFTLLVS